jgi:hypothetical protein
MALARQPNGLAHPFQPRPGGPRPAPAGRGRPGPALPCRLRAGTVAATGYSESDSSSGSDNISPESVRHESFEVTVSTCSRRGRRRSHGLTVTVTPA